MLHGYGRDEKDLESLIPILKSSCKNIDFVSIPAPFPCELGFGLQWFSMRDFKREPFLKFSDEAKKEFQLSQNYFKKIIKEELGKRNLTENDLVLLGFSQGATIVLYYSLYELDNSYIKSIVCSGFLPEEKELKLNKNTDFFLCHGKDDDKIPLNIFENTKKFLDENHIKNEAVVSENTGHWISEEAMDRIIKFINK